MCLKYVHVHTVRMRHFPLPSSAWIPGWSSYIYRHGNTHHLHSMICNLQTTVVYIYIPRPCTGQCLGGHVAHLGMCFNNNNIILIGCKMMNGWWLYMYYHYLQTWQSPNTSVWLEYWNIGCHQNFGRHQFIWQSRVEIELGGSKSWSVQKPSPWAFDLMLLV